MSLYCKSITDVSTVVCYYVALCDKYLHSSRFFCATTFHACSSACGSIIAYTIILFTLVTAARIGGYCSRMVEINTTVHAVNLAGLVVGCPKYRVLDAPLQDLTGY